MSESKKTEIQQTLGRLNRDVSQVFGERNDQVGAVFEVHGNRAQSLADARAEAKWLLALLERYEVLE